MTAGGVVDVVVAPSKTASAKPRMDVSGVRRSWETDMRNWRPGPGPARLRPIGLTEWPAGDSGSSRSRDRDLASRSPAAIAAGGVDGHRRGG